MIWRMVLVWMFGLAAAQAAERVDCPHGGIHYELAGEPSAVPVVLVHGFSTPMWVWEPLFEGLAAQGRTVLRFDLHGRGLSARAQSGDSLELFHEQIDTLREELHLPAQLDVVGLSMGGAISTSYAAKNPERVRRLVLIAPFNSSRNIAFLGMDGIGPWFMEHVFVPVALRYGYRRNFADPDAFLAGHPDFSERLVQHDGSRDYALALLSSLRNIIRYDQIAWYEQVGAQHTPTLLVWGEQDHVLPFEESARVRAALGDPPFVAVPDAGHLPHLEQSARTVPAILRFLR